MLEFTKKCMDRMENTMNSQDEFGIEKYGKPLDPMDDYDWLAMAEQEVADMIKYFNAERERRDLVLPLVIKELEKAHTAVTFQDKFQALSEIENAITRLKYLVKKR